MKIKNLFFAAMSSILSVSGIHAQTAEAFRQPYHPLGENKYTSLGVEGYRFSLPSEEKKKSWVYEISSEIRKEVRFA